MGRRLLLLVTDLLVGGTPTVVREVALRLHAAGVDVQVACLGGWGPTADEIRNAGVEVTALGARGMRDVHVFARVAKLIRDWQIDVVLSFLVHANVAAGLARLGQGFELYESIQTTQVKPRWHWWAQRLAERTARKIIVPSESVAQVARQRSGIAPEKIVVIPNAVDVPADFAAKAGDGLIRVVFIGRLDPIKRIPDLLMALSQLSDEYVLRIHGIGREEGSIRAQIQRLGLERRVSLMGASAGPWRALEEADVLVLPSEAEGFGLVLIEAMAVGVPVVATNAPGIRDVVRDGANGILAPVGDPVALAKAIREVATDAALRQKLVDEGRRTVARQYAWGPVIEAYRRTLGV